MNRDRHLLEIGLARARTKDGLTTGVVHAARFVGLRAFGWPDDTSISAMFNNWADTLAHIRSELAGHRAPLLSDAPSTSQLSFAAPIEPSQIFQVAQNYADHAGELGEQLPSRPFLFNGLPSAICGATDDVVLPAQGNHDWEVELGVVIAGRTFAVDTAVASQRIVGYTIANDITTRDALKRTDIARIDYIAAKNRPTFLPIGPYLVPADQVRIEDLTMQLRVNDHVRQDGRCSDMVFSPSELISILSQTTMLLPGDLLLTGTPAGCGHASGRYLNPGDIIDAQIPGLGRQRNRCVLAD